MSKSKAPSLARKTKAKRDGVRVEFDGNPDAPPMTKCLTAAAVMRFLTKFPPETPVMIQAATGCLEEPVAILGLAAEEARIEGNGLVIALVV